MKRSLEIALLLACCAGTGAAGAACEPGTGIIDACGNFTLQAENDSLAVSDAADRGYTNGTRLSWSWEPAADTPLDRLAGRLCFGAARGSCRRYATLGLGQSMYTPENLLARRRIIGDRPYGGWLYGMLRLDAQRERWAEHVEAYVGVIGPAARAEQAQTFFHRYVTPSAPEPRGWDNQIGNRLGLLLTFEHRWKLLEVSCHGHPWLDVAPTVGGAVGNVLDQADAGVTVRAGYNLPPRFFSQIPALVASTTALVAERQPTPTRWDAYLFAELDGRYVVHDVFIDTDDELYRIERRPLVRDHRLGASLRIRWLRLQFVQTFRSPEFRPETRWHSFGTVLITVGVSP